MTQPIKRLYRTRKGMIAGVCDGLGEYLRVDPAVLRLLTVAATFLTGLVPGLLSYLAAWVIVPLEPEAIPVRPEAQAAGGDAPDRQPA
jgi:phage shock protein C